MTREIKWTEITNSDQGNLEKVLKIYDQALPIELREPHDIFQKGLKYAANSFLNNFHFLVGMEDDTVVSFATAHYLAEVNAGFIVYIATNPLVRKRGIGSQTILKIEELLNKDALSAGNNSLRLSILETEIEEMVQTEVEKEDCIKRQRFFGKNNYHKFEEIDYLQPPLHGDDEGIPLHLFIKNIQGDPTLTQDEVNKIVQAMYQEKYYAVNEIDLAVLNNCLRKMKVKILS